MPRNRTIPNYQLLIVVELHAILPVGPIFRHPQQQACFGPWQIDLMFNLSSRNNSKLTYMPYSLISTLVLPQLFHLLQVVIHQLVIHQTGCVCVVTALKMMARFFFSNDVGGFRPGLLCCRLQCVRVIGVKNVGISFEPVVGVTSKFPIVHR